MNPGRRLRAALTAGLAASAGYAAARAVPRLAAPFARTNHAGRPVTLLEGPALVVGAALASSLGGPAGPVAVVGAGAFGALDDHAGDARSKGLRGHLGAAARGELTTGLVKIAGIGLSGLCAAGLSRRTRRMDPAQGAGRTSGLRGAVGIAADGALVAAAANLANLLDLRPGRALKASILAAAPMALSRRPGALAAAAVLGAAGGVLVPDLREESMLGDTGANAIGALVGVAVIERLGGGGRAVVLTGLVALTLASERVSFTRIIESTPVLRELDAWGRAVR